MAFKLVIQYYSEIFAVKASIKGSHLLLLQCSASCGDGVQQREVFCQAGDQRIPEESGCSQRLRPPTSQSCRVAPCPSRYRWREGDWQTVSSASPGVYCCFSCCPRSSFCSCFSSSSSCCSRSTFCSCSPSSSCCWCSCFCFCSCFCSCSLSPSSSSSSSYCSCFLSCFSSSSSTATPVF